MKNITKPVPRTPYPISRIQVHFLGTNGWYDTKTGNTLCILIDTPNEYVVLDAGNGIYKLDSYIKEEKPIHLFLSHLHLDHIIGFHAFAKFNFKQGINVYLDKGYVQQLKIFFDRPYTAPLKKLQTKVKFFEIQNSLKRIPFLKMFLPLYHVEHCLGFRFEFGNKVISFCPDTGICDNAFKLAKDADLLITECAFLAGQHNPNWPHLNPETGAEIAKKAKAKKLALVHFDAELYPTLIHRMQAQKAARKIFKNTVATYDGMRLEV